VPEQGLGPSWRFPVKAAEKILVQTKQAWDAPSQEKIFLMGKLML